MPHRSPGQAARQITGPMRPAPRRAEVTELIQGYVVAMNLETTEELMHTVFPHPSLSEMMKEAVLDACGQALNM